MKRYKELLIVFAIALLGQQCAKQTAPTGGPKDVIPPQLLQSSPKQRGINFKGSKIELTFDELVQVNNPREQVIITPGIGKKFEVTARKNKIILELNSELQENTTYNINFRESIQDLNEKNPAKVKIAFSTGTYLDSLSVSGHVSDILTDSKVKNYTVALVPATDTFNIFKHPAYWLTLTDDAGKFSVENLKPGNYFLYAFDDRNKNLIVDSKTEKFGFETDHVNLTRKTDSIKLNIFKLDVSNLKLISARPTFAYFNIRFNKSLVSYKLSPSGSQKISSSLESDLSTIKVYNTITGLDSLQVRVEASDSIGNQVDSLVFVKFPKKEATKDKFSIHVESADIDQQKSIFKATISLSKPVMSFNSDSIYVQVDSVTKIILSKTDFTWNENMTKVSVFKKLEARPKSPTTPEGQKKEQQKDQNIFTIRKASIISIENDSTTRITKPVKTILQEDHGVVSTKVNTKEDFILQLVEKNYRIVEEVKNLKNHSFENIIPGTYYIRILVDLNKNGKWDPGNYKSKTQPEPVIYYTNPKGGKDVFLKANWQLGDLLISY